MFEPTQGCPHLQPIELMKMAEDTFSAITPAPIDKITIAILITELVPEHMFPCVKTTMRWNGTSWMVSYVERLLEATGQKKRRRSPNGVIDFILTVVG